jgi:hypothetical protein
MPILEDEAQNPQSHEPVSIDEKAMIITQALGEPYMDFGGDTVTGPERGYRFYEQPLHIQVGLRDDRQRITILFYEKVQVRFLFFKTNGFRECRVYDQFNAVQRGKVVEQRINVLERDEKWLPLFEKLYQRALEFEKSISLEDQIRHHPSDPGL